MLVPLLLGAGVGMQGVGLYQQHSARKYAKRAAAVDQQALRIQAYRQRVQAAREQMIMQAELRNTAANSGVAGSSGVMGAASSVASQYGSSVGVARTISQLGEISAHLNRRAGSAGAQAQMYSQIGSTLSNFGMLAYKSGGANPTVRGTPNTNIFFAG